MTCSMPFRYSVNILCSRVACLTVSRPLQVPTDTSTINMSHVIHHMAFGPQYRGQINPLDGRPPALWPILTCIPLHKVARPHGDGRILIVSRICAVCRYAAVLHTRRCLRLCGYRIWAAVCVCTGIALATMFAYVVLVQPIVASQMWTRAPSSTSSKWSQPYTKAGQV